jgi:hypothetical protein
MLSHYTSWRRLGGAEEYSSYSFLTSALDGGERSASRSSRALAPGKNPGTHCTGGWVGPRACLDTEARGKILSGTFRIRSRNFINASHRSRQVLCSALVFRRYAVHIQLVLLRGAPLPLPWQFRCATAVGFQILAYSPSFTYRSASFDIRIRCSWNNVIKQLQYPSTAPIFWNWTSRYCF